MNILHLTHTDLRYDNRILKEIEVVSRIANTTTRGLGVNDISRMDNSRITNLNQCKNINLFTKGFKILPRELKYTLMLIELTLRFLFYGLIYRPKIIHCHDTMVLPVGFLLSLILKSKLIYDAHELESQKYGQSKALSFISLLIEKITWRNIDLLISVSPSIINWYQDNLGKKKYEIILNSPVLNSGFINSVPSNYLREKFNVPDNSKVFIYLGIIGGGRFIDQYIEIFKSHEIKSHIVFIGFGDYVEKVIEESLSSEKIHYHPPLKHNKVVEISRSADIGLLIIEDKSLSNYYALPNKLFEYAFSNLYILASDFPDIKHIVEGYGIGICTDTSFMFVKRKISEIENMNLIKSSKNLENLSWEHQSEKLIKSYDDLLNIN